VLQQIVGISAILPKFLARPRPPCELDLPASELPAIKTQRQPWCPGAGQELIGIVALSAAFEAYGAIVMTAPCGAGCIDMGASVVTSTTSLRVTDLEGLVDR